MSKQHQIVRGEGKIPVMYMKEGEMFVWYSPVLDLSTCGPTFEEAGKNFQEALAIFFQECLDHGTLDAALESYGWKKSSKAHSQWQPPLLVGQDSVSVHVPSAN